MTLYQQKNVMSYSSNVIIDNILPDSVIEKIPLLWRTAKQYPQDKYKLVFKAVRRSIANQPDVGLCRRICENSSGSSFFSMTYLLFKQIIKLPENKVNESSVRLSLEECKLPTSYIDIFMQNVLDKNAYVKLQLIAASSMVRNVYLVSSSWNINIALCSNSVGKIMEPVIALTLKLSSGKQLRFEVNAKQFHNLRFQVSNILKSIINLQNRQVLKIGT